MKKALTRAERDELLKHLVDATKTIAECLRAITEEKTGRHVE